MKKAVVLLSGGLDSSTCLAQAISDGFEVVALSIAYGQRHIKECEAAKTIADHFGVVTHHLIDIDLSAWGESSLTDHSMIVPSDGLSNKIPSTYVPGRNTVFIALALSLAESIGAKAIYLGINAVDYSGYPDCRPEYIEAYQKLALLSSKSAIEGNRIQLVTPLINLSKVDIVKKAINLNVPIDKTWSCYQGDDEPCGVCDSCRIRNAAIQSAKDK